MSELRTSKKFQRKFKGYNEVIITEYTWTRNIIFSLRNNQKKILKEKNFKKFEEILQENSKRLFMR